MTENHDLITILTPFLLVKPCQHIFLVIFKSLFKKKISHQGALGRLGGVVASTGIRSSQLGRANHDSAKITQASYRIDMKQVRNIKVNY